MPAIPNNLAPIILEARFPILDSLRGLAILGILLMNISYFGMGDPSTNDPSVLNEMGTINYHTWWIIQWLPEGTQRAMFSMLFGAGILFLTDAKGNRAYESGKINYFFRRQLWLIAFSMTDVFILLWNGDILFDYAIFGMIMHAFRKLPATRLIIGAIVCLFFMLLRENRELYLKKERIYKGEMAAARERSGHALTIDEKISLQEMQEFEEFNSLENKKLRNTISISKVSASYPSLFKYRTGSYLNKMFDYIFFAPWDLLLFMFLGMAFFKLGILTGIAPLKVYWSLFIVGMLIGLYFSYWRLHQLTTHQFNDYKLSKDTKFSYYELSRTFRALGIFGGIILLYK